MSQHGDLQIFPLDSNALTYLLRVLEDGGPLGEAAAGTVSAGWACWTLAPPGTGLGLTQFEEGGLLPPVTPQLRLTPINTEARDAFVVGLDALRRRGLVITMFDPYLKPADERRAEGHLVVDQAVYHVLTDESASESMERAFRSSSGIGQVVFAGGEPPAADDLAGFGRTLEAVLVAAYDNESLIVCEDGDPGLVRNSVQQLLP